MATKSSIHKFLQWTGFVGPPKRLFKLLWIYSYFPYVLKIAKKKKLLKNTIKF